MKIYLYLSILLTAGGTFAAELSVDEIINKANDASYYAGSDGMADVEMTIHDAKGGTRERAFRILRLNGSDGDQKFYVYFNAPADVRKMALLVWKNAKKEDDRWLWLPALNLVKRIAPGDKRTSFVGSDFVYEDVSGRSPDADTHELIETTDTHYVIRNTPKDKEEVEFSEYTVWVDKTNFLPTKAEYIDRKNNLYRRVSATDIKTIDGIPTVTEAMVEDLQNGSKTINRFSNISYDNKLNDRIFTERFLRRPPREATQ